MEPITTLRSRTVVMPATNIDTDQIIPGRFLTTTTKEGLGKQLFADWRESGCSMCLGMNGDTVPKGE